MVRLALGLGFYLVLLACNYASFIVIKKVSTCNVCNKYTLKQIVTEFYAPHFELTQK